jgi:hypothetical protein
MKYKSIARYLQSSVFGVFLVFIFCLNIEAFDFSDWDILVKKYVASETLEGVSLNAVDYARLKKDPLFSELISRLESYHPERLVSLEAKLAFWINVYNILAAKMITDHYPLESIKDVGSFFKSVWKLSAGNVGGKERTLNDIEHEILRKMNEPRIHVAIVCASISCPDLRREAYVAEKLSEQLDDQMKSFLQSRSKGMKWDEQKNRVFLSAIFKWFAEDFASRGGVLTFIEPYLSLEDKAILINPKIKISYLNYNWKINGH